MRLKEIRTIRQQVSYHKPTTTALILVVSIFVCELLLMKTMAHLTVHPSLEIYLDPLILVILLAPVLYFTIISPLRKNQMALWTMANTDSLTFTFNRFYFMDAARREISRARRPKTPVSILMIDVDHFKKINDTHGHPAGDAALTQVAEILGQQIRDYDILARYGGEEFVVLLPGADLQNALMVAERCRQGIEKARFRTGPVTISVGVATHQEPESLDELLQRADQQLYRAKKDGRNRTCCTDDFQIEL